MSEAPRPRLRADLELFMAEAEREPVLVVRDPEMLAVGVVRFGAGVLPILELLDGHHTTEDMRVEFLRRGAGVVEPEQLDRFLTVLDRCLFLDNERTAAERAVRREFLASPVRRPAHAGVAYPAEPEAARRFFDGLLQSAPPGPAAGAATLTRLIAPHIDLELGRQVHAAAIRRLEAAGRPDAVVVLGVRHEAGPERFVACRKDFDTPQGRVPHDAALLDALEERLGERLDGGETAHLREHSVEFQAAWLAHLWPGDPPPLVPLLVGSFGDFIDERRSPASDPGVDGFVRALRDVIAGDGRRIVTVASVDLAHVGPAYEDPEGLDERGEKELEDRDRETVDCILRGDPEAFFEDLAHDGNARHVCGTAPIYLALGLGDGPGELLRYGQGRIHPESGSVVSFAAIAFAS